MSPSIRNRIRELRAPNWDLFAVLLVIVIVTVSMLFWYRTTH
jgi:hypothetical protein